MSSYLLYDNELQCLNCMRNIYVDPNREIIYVLQVADIQDIAMQNVGRELTSNELHDVKKGIESGFGDSWYVVVETAINCLGLRKEES